MPMENNCEEIENFSKMSRRGLWITMKFKSVVDVVRASRFQSSFVNGGLQRNNSPIVSAAKAEKNGYWISPGLQFFTTNSKPSINEANGVKDVKVQPQVVPSSTIFSFPNWLRWVLGSVLTLLLPFWKYNWEKLRRIEGEAEVVVEEVETVASVVEKVATVAEKVSEDVAEMLPQNGNLKKAAIMLEHASQQVVHDAQLTKQFIHKVEEVRNDLDDLESFVEPVIDKIVNNKETGKK